MTRAHSFGGAGPIDSPGCTRPHLDDWCHAERALQLIAMKLYEKLLKEAGGTLADVGAGPQAAITYVVGAQGDADGAVLRRDAIRVPPRHWPLADLLMGGRKTAEIAAELHLAPGTVNNRISNLMREMGATSRAELVARLNGHPATNGARRGVRGPELAARRQKPPDHA